MDRIERITPNGNKMIKFGADAEEIDLLFHTGEYVQTIQIFQRSFKTPSTGFNSKNELEINLYKDIYAILYP